MLPQRNLDTWKPITPHTNVRATVSSDGGVLLNVATGAVFSLNPVGAEIWQMITQGMNEDAPR
jgi:hypothetical protein